MLFIAAATFQRPLSPPSLILECHYRPEIPVIPALAKQSETSESALFS